jgi:bacterioferritin-associated ferredoxin
VPVLVCHCQAVCDREIRAAVRSGACSLRQVARACGAGRSCGGCRPAIHEIIESEHEPSASFLSLRELALPR